MQKQHNEYFKSDVEQITYTEFKEKRIQSSNSTKGISQEQKISNSHVESQFNHAPKQ